MVTVRSSAPPLLPLFRSDGQARVVAELFLHPEREVSLSELGRRVGLHSATIQREIARLEGAGLVRSRRVGSARVVRADDSSPVFDDLSRLVIKTLGPPAVLAEVLAGVDGVREAHVFGSWAARTLGAPGPAPDDVDVLVVGEPDRRGLSAAATRAAVRLGRDVAPVVVAPDEWESPTRAFVRSVKDGPLVAVPLAPAGGNDG